MSDVLVTRNDDELRYEARIDGELAGICVYQLTDDLVVFTHTEVDDRFEGQGVGSALARYAIEDVAADGSRMVLPLCPFVKAWLGRHPEYAALVSDS